MLFGYLTLITALAISLSAGVYSVIGLTAIFSGAFWPIVIMGGTLEVGKIITTLWLHKYWEKAEARYKIYLSLSVAVLMVLTSMGVFGFLSKAHTEAGVATGDVVAQVSIYDEKIKTQRDNIAAARQALQQMDAAVDQTMSRTTSEGGADKAVAIRRSQAKERSKLQAEITTAQSAIVKLQEERAPFAAQQRQVEADVGPIKYIAALIYGDTTDQTVLEQAVRWVIILIVAVFDPLALTLLLAATKTFEWERDTRKKRGSWDEFFNGSGAGDDFEPRSTEQDSAPAPIPIDNEQQKADEANSLVSEIEPEEPTVENCVVTEEDESSVAQEANLLVSEIEPDEPLVENCVSDEEELEAARHDIEVLVQTNTELATDKHELEAKVETLEEDNRLLHGTVNDLFGKLQKMTLNEEIREAERIARELAEKKERARKRRAKHKPVIEESKLDVAALQKQIEDNKTVEPAEPVEVERPGDYLNQIQVVADNEPSVGHGDSFPVNAKAGDLYMRVDFMPSKMFKYTGENWIEVDKHAVNVPLNEEYVDYLIDKMMSNDYHPDHLSEVEREHIAERLAHRG